MSERIVQTTNTRAWTWLISAITLGLALMFFISPGALAEDPTPEPTTVPTEPPLGDCYGGVLSHAPLHCYALEHAEDEGVINIEAVYLAEIDQTLLSDGDSLAEGSLNKLYIFVTEDQQTVLDEVYEHLYQNIREYAQTRPGHMKTGRFFHDWCNFHATESPAACVIRIIDQLADSEIEDYDSHFLFKDYSGYAQLRVRGGGKDARHDHKAWASWKQVWPSEETGGQNDVRGENGAGKTEGEDKASESIPAFDVSDVDLGSIPRVDCNNPIVEFRSERNCKLWQGFPEFHFLGQYPWSIPSGYSQQVNYLLKIPAKDVDKWRAVLEERNPGHAERGREIVVKSVNHDFGELWHYTIVLNRFSTSRGNTLGILYALVTLNFDRGSAVIWPTAGLEPLDLLAEPMDWSNAQETIMLVSNDADSTANALSTLLPRLGIPEDAVGLVVQHVPPSGPGRPFPLPTVNSSYDPSLGDWGLGWPKIETTGENGKDIVEEDASLPHLEEIIDELRTEVGAANSGQSGKVDSTITPESIQNLSKQPSNGPDDAQPDSLAIGDQSAPNMDTPTPAMEDRSWLSPWALALISIGVVAMALVAAFLAKIRLQRLDF